MGVEELAQAHKRAADQRMSQEKIQTILIRTVVMATAKQTQADLMYDVMFCTCIYPLSAGTIYRDKIFRPWECMCACMRVCWRRMHEQTWVQG